MGGPTTTDKVTARVVEAVSVVLAIGGGIIDQVSAPILGRTGNANAHRMIARKPA